MTANQVPATVRKYAWMISDVDRDPAGWSFGLIDGLICSTSETHQVMESTLTECASAFQDVEPCECGDHKPESLERVKKEFVRRQKK
jgi:hypothetical protein